MLRLFKAVALLAITGALVSGVAFAQTPPFWFFCRRPSLIKELKSGSSKKEVAKNGQAAKNKLGYKKSNRTGIVSSVIAWPNE